MPSNMLNALLGAPIENWQYPDYGLRVDETPKKAGFLGELPMDDNRVMTEQSVGDLVKLFGTTQLSNVFHIDQLFLKIIRTDVAES